MSEASKQWVGKIVDGKFPLREQLGESDHSAVFLTEYTEGESRKAAIKLIAADAGTADLQLSSWNFAAHLSHPNLLRVFATGRCSLEGNDLLYLVMEYAEENLSEIIPQRGLTSEETRDMLCPVLDALEYLHGKGLVHGDLKPANILASGDSLKISSDTISRSGEAQIPSKKPGVYDPPEAISGILTPAADVWSLGTTLVEVMTQRLPEWQPGPHREPVVPANLPEPFQEIARKCLRLEPQRRASVAEVASRLNSRVAVASAAASASMAMPVPSMQTSARTASPTMPMHIGPVAPPSKVAARLQTNPHRPERYRESGTRSRFIIPMAVVGAVIFAAILTVPHFLTNRPETRYSTIVAQQKPVSKQTAENPVEAKTLPKTKGGAEHVPQAAQTAKPSLSSSSPITSQAPPPANADTLKATSDKEQPSPAVPASPSANPAETAKPAEAGIVSSQGEVLDQVLPDVSSKARATIRGRVRVGIKLQVDAAGAVSGAELDSPGPSKFFADLALQAARKWVFTPPEVAGKSVASEWSLRFVFTQDDTKVTPTRTTP